MIPITRILAPDPAPIGLSGSFVVDFSGDRVGPFITAPRDGLCSNVNNTFDGIVSFNSLC